MAEIEITRGDLNQVLLDAVAGESARSGGPGADYRYGEYIRDLREHRNGVSVTLASGRTEEYDLVIGADGLHSATRLLAFGPEEQFSTGWTTGRIALVGDAGYCGSPLSGQGTAMALVGAYILVGEIARTPDRPAEALSRYTRLLRPFVETAQQLPPGGVKGITPRTRPGIVAARALLRVATSRMAQPLMTRMVSQTENYVLPDYPAGHTAATR
ncbi:Rossmann-fold NAD(P)-binding domain-containing protein [Nocardia sp. X0981]